MLVKVFSETFINPMFNFPPYATDLIIQNGDSFKVLSFELTVVSSFILFSLRLVLIIIGSLTQ